MTFRKQLDKVMKSRQDQADWIPVIKFIGALIYLSGITYAGSHVFSFISSIMTDDFLRVMAFILLFIPGRWKANTG
jgi:hypothetical protein